MKNVRNIVRLTDVPSNTIEEAIIIFKENKKAKKYEYSNNFSQNKNQNIDDKEYIVKEAELIISDYLNCPKNKEIDLIRKNKKLKLISVGLGLLLIMSIIL